METRAILVSFLGVVSTLFSAAPANSVTMVSRGAVSPEAEVGARLFAEPRFAQFFFAHSAGHLNAALSAGDPVLAGIVSASRGAKAPVSPFAGQAMSCRICHLGGELKDVGDLPVQSSRALADFAARSPVPERDDGRRTTPRNSPSLVEALAGPASAGLFHFDGEFATAEVLVKGTFLGRNFGWLPNEQAEARRHFARVIREDDGAGDLARAYAQVPYAVLLRGTAPAIPAALRQPESFRHDPVRATDDEVLDGCARLVVAFLRSLHFSRDADGLHNGSPYDAFLTLNRLPRAATGNQTPHEYARRLGEAVAALRSPRFVDDPARRLRLHDQAFRFGELELRGMRIFFKAAIGAGQTGGAGNCAECHVPPHFTDFAFHNTGVAQDEYDAVHGAGEFAKLVVPDLATRAADYDRWLPPTSQHPRANGRLLASVTSDLSGRTDLGLWNVYANPDLPASQAPLETLLNPGGQLARDAVLAGTLARFKTSALRDLGQSDPYLHTGRARTIEEAISFYQRVSQLAHEGKLRNAPPEFFAMRLEPADVTPLAAFLRALNEDCEGVLP